MQSFPCFYIRDGVLFVILVVGGHPEHKSRAKRNNYA